MCGRKHAYYNSKDANWSSYDQRVYKCPFCGKYHRASNNAAQQTDSDSDAEEGEEDLDKG